MEPALRRRLNAFFAPAAGGRVISEATGFGLGSTIGPVRSENQDRCFVAHLVSGGPVKQELLVAAILDGMGGMIDGGEAAAIAAGSFVEALLESHGVPGLRLAAAVAAANDAVYDRFRGRGGTTLTAIAFADPRSASVVHVGDSRLYRIDRPAALALVTADDTLRGVIDSKHSASDEDDLDNRLIQFVGIGDDISPAVFNVANDAQTVWLLTTDGAHGLGRRALEGVVRSPNTPEAIVRRLLVGADALGVEDNASAVAIRPHQYSAAIHDFEGTTIRLWTPSEHLEIWVGSEGRTRSVDKQAKVKPETGAAKPSRGTKTRRKKPAKSASQAKPVPDEPGDRPEGSGQMSITFGRSPGIADG